MDELPLVKTNTDKVLNMSSFTSGNAYSDFNPKIDKIAVWTIGGLVAGKVLAKAGLFAVFTEVPRCRLEIHCYWFCCAYRLPEKPFLP